MIPLGNDSHLHGIDLLLVQVVQYAIQVLHLFKEICAGFTGKNSSDLSQSLQESDAKGRDVHVLGIFLFVLKSVLLWIRCSLCPVVFVVMGRIIYVLLN